MKTFILSAVVAAVVAGSAGEVAAQIGVIIDRGASFALLACDLEGRGGPRVIFLQTATDADRIGRDPIFDGDIRGEACAPVLAALLDAGLDIRDSHTLSLRPGEGEPRRRAILWELVERRR